MSRTTKRNTENYKKQTQKRRVFMLILFAILVILCVCLFTPVFGITEIRVSGTQAVPQETVIELSGITKGQNVFRMRAHKAEEKICAAPYVKSAVVKRKFPAVVYIEIEENKKDLIFDTPDKFIITTVEGRVLEESDDVTEISAPLVYGVNVKDAPQGKALCAENEDLYSVGMERIGAFYGSSYWQDIDSFDISESSNFMLTMRSGMKVTFGYVDSVESLKRKMKMMDAIFPQIKQTKTSYLDMTTDKGYFGEYTAFELEEMKKKEEAKTAAASSSAPSNDEDAENQNNNSGESMPSTSPSADSRKEAKASSSPSASSSPLPSASASASPVTKTENE